MALLEICQWLQDTPFSTSLRESTLGWPILEGSHLLGLGISAGTIAISDLRMMGLILRKEPVSEVMHQILPWTIAGFLMMVVTGTLLLISEPVKCYESIWFRLKVLFLFLAAINVFVFHTSKLYKNMAEWDHDLIPPRAAKLCGVVSLISWGIVIIAGRTTAYNF